ncbi:uncharacterized protein LOC108678018 [Hyalella azteca]|uniref:Uncharacterized protein LOC108678018 n=1 Tax=Hyalella azteca TaxID=294128 RepID=A0A8B7P7L8_HYAAZ|nr:uncharacterized protein LOC108678018 [Hyalella azteca]
MENSDIPSDPLPALETPEGCQDDGFSASSSNLRNSSVLDFCRRASLGVDGAIKTPVCLARRFSTGTACVRNIRRRFSLGEDRKRFHLAGSNISINEAHFRRLSVDSCLGVYDPRRRSSLGAESLIEYDLEEENEPSADQRVDLPSDALLGLQYADDVFAVKKALEIKYHPLRCLENQPQVTEPVRCAIVNWLLKVNRKLNFGSETLFLAVHFLDRFLTLSAIASDCVQLLAVCALFVAAKMEEIKVPGISALSRVCSAPFQRHHFRRMEILLLTKLGFYLHAPTSWYFINHLALKACQLGYLDRKVTRAARRVSELCLCRYDITQYSPSVQAAAAFLSAISILEPELARTLPCLFEAGKSDHLQCLIDEETMHCASCSLSDEPEWCLDDHSPQCCALLNNPPGEDEGGHHDVNERGEIEEEQEYKADPTLVSALVLAIKLLYKPSELEEISSCWTLMAAHMLPYEEQLLQEASKSASSINISALQDEAKSTELKDSQISKSSAMDELEISESGSSSEFGLASECSSTRTDVVISEKFSSSCLDRRDSGIVTMEIDLQQRLIDDNKLEQSMK